jgi:hypothetical protein
MAAMPPDKPPASSDTDQPWSRRFRGANPVDTFGPARAPDFLCIGSEKAGTTWLWNCMMSHPGIGVPATKELRFFNEGHTVDYAHFRALKRFLEDPRAAPLRPQYLERIATELRLLYGGLPAYYRIFGQLDQPVVGELTPQYCVLAPKAVQAMRDVAPRARIIYMLRDPADRILSGARMVLRSRNLPFDDAGLWAEAADPMQRRLTDAATHIATYEAIFGREAVGVFFFDDIRARPEALFREICDFIGAERADVPPDVLRLEVNKGPDGAASDALRRKVHHSLSPVYAQLAHRFPERVAVWRARYGAV